jgi:hypothetical protein
MGHVTHLTELQQKVMQGIIRHGFQFRVQNLFLSLAAVQEGNFLGIGDQSGMATPEVSFKFLL